MANAMMAMNASDRGKLNSMGEMALEKDIGGVGSGLGRVDGDARSGG